MSLTFAADVTTRSTSSIDTKQRRYLPTGPKQRSAVLRASLPVLSPSDNIGSWGSRCHPLLRAACIESTSGRASRVSLSTLPDGPRVTRTTGKQNGAITRSGRSPGARRPARDGSRSEPIAVVFEVATCDLNAARAPHLLERTNPELMFHQMPLRWHMVLPNASRAMSRRGRAAHERVEIAALARASLGLARDDIETSKAAPRRCTKALAMT